MDDVGSESYTQYKVSTLTLPVSPALSLYTTHLRDLYPSLIKVDFWVSTPSLSDLSSRPGLVDVFHLTGQPSPSNPKFGGVNVVGEGSGT